MENDLSAVGFKCSHCDNRWTDWGNKTGAALVSFQRKSVQT